MLHRKLCIIQRIVFITAHPMPISLIRLLCTEVDIIIQGIVTIADMVIIMVVVIVDSVLG